MNKTYYQSTELSIINQSQRNEKYYPYIVSQIQVFETN